MAVLEPDYGHPERGAAELDQEIQVVCPIHGVSVGRWDDRSTWRIDFHPDATEEQKAAARQVLAAFKLQDAHAEDMGAPDVIA